MPEEIVDTPVENAPPDDYEAYEKWAAEKDMQPGNVERAEDDIEEDDETASEAPVTEAETAAESETAATQEQEEKPEEEDDEEEQSGKGRGVQKRISKLTAKIRELEERLSEPKDPEVAEPKPVEKKADDGKPVAPKLADFEKYEEYEAAHAEFVEKLTDWKADQLESKRQADDAKKALETAQAEHRVKWSEAAAQFDDFNEVVGNEDVQISQAMESVLRGMEPEIGTALSYYLGKHPEESLRIAKATLADNEPQWRAALARAGRELGKLEDKLSDLKPKKDEKKAAPAPKKEPPKVTAAPKPPAKVAGTRAAATVDVHDEKSAEDYEVWERARNKQLRRR